MTERILQRKLKAPNFRHKNHLRQEFYEQMFPPMIDTQLFNVILKQKLSKAHWKKVAEMQEKIYQENFKDSEYIEAMKEIHRGIEKKIVDS